MDSLQHLLQQERLQNRPDIINLEALFGVVAAAAVNSVPVVVEVVARVAQFLCLQALYQPLQL
jgi:hypothetical protein